eukprot:3938181-Rhodomonas_salina.7
MPCLAPRTRCACVCGRAVCDDARDPREGCRLARAQKLCADAGPERPRCRTLGKAEAEFMCMRVALQAAARGSEAMEGLDARERSEERTDVESKGPGKERRWQPDLSPFTHRKSVGTRLILRSSRVDGRCGRWRGMGQLMCVCVCLSGGAALAVVGGQCSAHSEVTALSLAQQSLGPEALRWLCLPPTLDSKQHPIRHLSSLDLGHNELKPRGCSLLSHALPYMPLLAQLLLPGAAICDTACQALAVGLACCSRLGLLNLEENKIGASGVDALLPTFKHTTSLQVACCSITIVLPWSFLASGHPACCCPGSSRAVTILRSCFFWAWCVKVVICETRLGGVVGSWGLGVLGSWGKAGFQASLWERGMLTRLKGR